MASTTEVFLFLHPSSCGTTLQNPFQITKTRRKMKLYNCNAGIMQNQSPKQVIGIPIRSGKRLLLDFPSTSNESSKTEHGKAYSVIGKVNKLGEKVDSFAQGIREHVRLSPKLIETVKGKLTLGARILQVGGVEKVFKQIFNAGDGEKLLMASQCYLSTTSGPIAGLLFISTDKIAFCSERSIKLLSPSGKLLRIHYKISIPLRKIKAANSSEDAKRPSQKYIEVVTEDNFEFWFMGFLNHRKTLKYLSKAIARTQ